LGTPAVRQFERQRNFSVALLLDLWLPPNPTGSDRQRLELAVSFAATALADLVRCGSGRLTVAVAGKKATCFAGQATAAFVQEVTDLLAVEPGGQDSLPEAIKQLCRQWPAGAAGVVVSTRNDQRPALAQRGACSELDFGRVEAMAWLNVASPHVHTFFRWQAGAPAAAAIPEAGRATRDAAAAGGAPS
jgi:hypothetical protein